MSKKKIICEILFVGAILLIMGGLQTNFSGTSNKVHIVTPQTSTDPTAFISVWNTSITSTDSSNSTSITLPLVSSGTYNFTVQWGDGNSSIVTSYNSVNATHNYGTTGVYTLTITGELSGWQFANSGDHLKILDISQWGSMNLGNSQDYFMNCSNLVLTATDALNLTGTTNLYRAFEFCPNLGSAGNMDGWNVSEVNDMQNMFYGDSAFNQPIGSWNVSEVNDMQNMFYGDTAFNQPIGSWNVSKVTNMGNMFYGDSAFNQPIGSWNVSKVTNMGNIFSGDTAFNQPIGNWTVSSVTDMEYMFYGDSAFNQPIGSWNVSSVTKMPYMFYNATSFNKPIGNWDVSSVTYMGAMFQDASAFNQNIDNWNVSSVSNMANMFYSDSAFNQPIENWNVSSVINMPYMFDGAISFNQPIGSWDVSNVTYMNYMFDGAISFNQPIGNWNVSKVTQMPYMFGDDSAFNQSIGNWNVSNVTYMGAMFQGDSAFNQPIGNWNVSKVTNMDSMFYNATSFNQPIGSWNVSNATTLARMFYYAASFNQNIGTWNVSKVTDMTNMFTGDTAFSSENYGYLLIGWSQLTLQSNVQFSAGSTQYWAGAPATAHQKLISTYKWNIVDGGLALPSTPVLSPITSPSTTGTITFSWAPSISATSYMVYRSTSTITTLTGATMIASNITETSYQDTNLADGTYYYVIVATNGVMNSSISNCENVAVISISSAPTNLNATTETTYISLTWDAPTNNGGSVITCYNIYRSNSVNGQFTTIGNSTTTSFNDNNVIGGQTYYYKVSAVNIVGESSFSNFTSIAPIFKPTQPTNLNATSETTYISLTWVAPTNNGGSSILYYDIYRSTSANGPFTLIGNSTNTSYNDNNATIGQNYYYEVTAVNNIGESSFSTAANATINAPKSSNSNLGWIIFGIVGGIIIAAGVVSYVYLQKNPEKRDLLNEKFTPIKQKTNDLIKKLKEKTEKPGNERDPSNEEQEL